MKGNWKLKKYINECVGCPPERGCLGLSCPKRRRIIYICDWCGAELDGERCRDWGFEFCSACEAYRNEGRIYKLERNARVKCRPERPAFRQCWNRQWRRRYTKGVVIRTYERKKDNNGRSGVPFLYRWDETENLLWGRKPRKYASSYLWKFKGLWKI